MPHQMLQDAARGNSPLLLASSGSFKDEQFQPASIDLRLGKEIHALSATFVPRPEQPVSYWINRYSQYDFELSEGKTHHLDAGKTYIVPLDEQCAFSDQVAAFFSPKSSTGRTDLFVRVVTENDPGFNRTPFGYNGKLWLQITPLSFHQGIRAGLSLVQGRIKTRETKVLSSDELMLLHTKYGIVYDKHGKPLDHKSVRIEKGKFYFHVDLDRDVVGLRARKGVRHQLDLSVPSGTLEPRDFWEPIYRERDGVYQLDPDGFYLLATKERVHVPPSCCGQMDEYDVDTGEFRVHYAGFFDNGFGGDAGTSGVLEVRAHSVPFFLVDGQPICAMVFEQTFEVPTRLYRGNYKDSRPSLSKHFARRYEAWEVDYWRSI